MTGPDDGLDRLPALRQELSLHPGPLGAGGAPCWLLHDPGANRFYEIDWPAFELLSRWPLGRGQAVLAAVNSQTTLRLGLDDLQMLVKFLVGHQLVQATSTEQCEHLWKRRQAARPGLAGWLLKNYLFFRVPLLRPEPLLDRLLPCFGMVFSRGFWWAMLALLALALTLVSLRWDEFTHTFSAYGGLGAAVGIGVSLSLAKMLHEIGHGMAARRLGCRVPAMGVAFLVMLPVLYTDTNDAWKLRTRKERLLVGAAGMLAELVLAIGATLAWSFLPDGPLRAGVFLLATTTWVATLAINASPFMRFDGYFLLSDALGMPNLHQRAFALARWQLRRTLLGLQDDPPEKLPPARRHGLIGFAWATWLYRLVLFFSIALLVYHLFFKALGLLLMAVELGWFIARPVAGELAAWWHRRADLRWGPAPRRSLGALLLALAALAVPWRAGTSQPAILGARQSQGMYAPAAAEVEEVLVKEGQQVVAGTLLLRMNSPELSAQLALAQAREHDLAIQAQQLTLHPEIQRQASVIHGQWEVAQQQVRSLLQQQAQLALTAPFAGRVVDLGEALKPGTVLAPGERLMDLVATDGRRGEAYVSESSLPALRAGAKVRFIADDAEMPTLSCRLGPIDPLNQPSLDAPLLSSTYGGPIAAEHRDRGIVPLEAVFRVRLEQCDAGPAPRREVAGRAHIETPSQSLLLQGLRRLGEILQREAGF